MLLSFHLSINSNSKTRIFLLSFSFLRQPSVLCITNNLFHTLKDESVFPTPKSKYLPSQRHLLPFLRLNPPLHVERHLHPSPPFRLSFLKNIKVQSLCFGSYHAHQHHTLHRKVLL